MNLIALVGFIGSGKDTVGRHLVETHGFYDIAFADALKDTCAAIFHWDREMLDGKNPQSRIWRTQVDPWWATHLGIPAFSPRWALQNVGTDILRKTLSDDLWILNVRRRIARIHEQHGPDAKIVLTDGRFPNELRMVRELGGGVLRIKRGEEPAWYADAMLASHGLMREGDARSDDRREAISAASVRMAESGNHISEWAWIAAHFDGVLCNDSSLDVLFDQVDRFIQR